MVRPFAMKSLIPVVVLISLAVTVPAVLATPASITRMRACGTFVAQHTKFGATVSRGSVACRTARKVLKAFVSGKGHRHGPANGPAYLQTWTVYGWTCGHGTGGGACVRNHNRDRILAQIR